MLKGDHQAIGLFFSKCTERRRRFINLWQRIPSRLQIQVEHYINQKQNTYSEMSLSSYYVIRLKKIDLRMQLIFMMEW